MKSQEIFVIDSHAYLHRNYFALPKLISPLGEEVGALYGFTRLLLKIIKEKKPEFFAVCYDSRVKTFRDRLYDQYKANRPKTDEALIKQIEISKRMARGLGLREITVDGYEADDIIAALAGQAVLEGKKAVIISGDKDLAQLVGENVLLWEPGEKEYRGRDYVISRFGLPPEKISDYLSLVGDSSDNIPGVKGVGPRTAVKLIEKYGSADRIIEKVLNGSQDMDLVKIRANLKNFELSRKLVALNTELPIEIKIEDFRVVPPRAEELRALAERFRFRELVNMTLSGTSAQGDLFETHSVGTGAVAAFSEITVKEFLLLEKKYVAFEPGGNAVVYDNVFARYSSAELDDLLALPLPKYFYKLKDFMHEKGAEPDLNNSDDIYVAYHLCHGGERKPELSRIVAENSAGFLAAEDAFSCAFRFREVMENLSGLLAEKGLTELYRETEMPLAGVLFRMEEYGMLLDVARLGRLSGEFEAMVEAVKKDFAAAAGCEINLNSPKQVSHFVYEKLTLPIDDKQKKMFRTKTGYSTSEEALKFLEPMHPSIRLILKHRELVKLKNSFIDPLLEKVGPDGTIRTNFDQTGTQTGRLSSSDPNLQNIPVKGEHGRLIRSCFTARPGSVLLSADYSQIDLRVMAHISGDANLKMAFDSGEDIHLRTACQIFGLPPEKVDSDVRKIAKTINFGIIYGQTPMGLSRELGISYDEAGRYIEDYFRTYAGVRKWLNETMEYARKNGFVRNFAGRIRYIPDINSPNRNIRLFAERMAVNMPVQSGSSDIIKRAMVNLDRVIRDSPEIKMISQIHDELLFDVKETYVPEAASIIRKVMESSFKLSVPLIVDIKIGKNWSEMQKYRDSQNGEG